MVDSHGRNQETGSNCVPTGAYDSLQRLQSAITVTDPLVTQWGQNFSYDGWGNLLGASVAKGSAPTFSVTVNGLTNRITGQSYDANGNQAVTGSSYDVENRLKGAGTYPNYYQYTYDGSNKRVAKSVPLTWDDENGTVFGEELLMFYGAGGERLAEFTMSIVKFGAPSQWYLRFTEKKTLVWFGSKLLRDGKYSVIQDRLGSVRWRRDTTNNQTETADYYPYGQEKPSATTNDREKFATYLRDPESGLDYADQRYHNPGWGRFLTADPYQSSARAKDPGSWNRYAYVEGDPANLADPRGLSPLDFWGSPNLMMHPDGGMFYVGCGSDSNLTYTSDAEARHLGYVNSEFAANALTNGVAPAIVAVAFPLAEVVTSTVYCGCGMGDDLCQNSDTGQVVPNPGGFFGITDGTLDLAVAGAVATDTIRAVGTIASAAGELTGPLTALDVSGIEEGAQTYRLWGGRSGPFGQSWGPIDPRTLADPRAGLGLPAGNTAEWLSIGTLSDTSSVYFRPALPLGKKPGGVAEWVVPDPRIQVINITTIPFP